MSDVELQHKLDQLPTKPGVYLMLNEAGEIIYVGKAINLRNRVRSYFRKGASQSAKVRIMAGQISDIDYIVTDSEMEALILENNLIKKHAPRYNVRLKDDKTYPYIKVTVQEPFPRVLLVRRRLADGARYFGPYTDVSAVRRNLAFLRTFFPVRSCRKVIEGDTRGRPCLNYHIGRCLAPCAQLVSGETYGEMIAEVLLFLEGRIDRLIPGLRTRMEQAAEILEFEKAARLRNQIQALESLAQEQKMVAEHTEDYDFVGYARRGELACIQIFFVRGGKLIGREHFLLDCSSEEEGAEILRSFLQQYYEDASYIPKGVFTPLALTQPDLLERWLGSLRGSRVYLHTPKRGQKKQLIDLAMKNAEILLKETLSRAAYQKKAAKRAREELAALLEMDDLPVRIEAFDVSNLQGTNVVASLVVWEDGALKPDQYRRFRIREVQDGPNDYRAMEEAVTRRFKRGLAEQAQAAAEGKFSVFPDLVLIDGGKGQLGAALKVQKELALEIPFLALAERREEIYLAGRSQPVVLGADSPGLLLLRQIRDEAHRFALAYHRNLRGKAARGSVLDEIPGIGPQRKKDLLKHFGSAKKIGQASLEELAQVRGISVKLAQEIYQHLHKAPF